MYPLSRRSTTPPFSVLLFVTLLFQVTVYAQSDVDHFDIFPCTSDGDGSNCTPAVTGEETTTNDNYNKGIDEVFGNPSGDLSGSSCECVLYYLCNDDNTLNTDGTGVIDIRFNTQCKQFYHKCCNTPKDEKDKIRLNDKDNRINCGHWNSNGAGWRIVGDSNNEAQFGEFPWMVGIFKTEPMHNLSIVCGASLIHPQVVLTAIHCIQDKNPDKLLIRAGEWDTNTEFEQIIHQDRHILKIIKHEKYYGGAVHNDIALIILTEKFILRENVGTVCLPPQGYQYSSERCYVSGWGKNASSTGVATYQNILKKIDVPIVPRSTCLKLLRQTRLGQRFQLHESFMCAGGEIGKDACKGDGGSPLVCPVTQISDQYHQAGIVAWGIGCGDETPGVYVDVAQFRDWIDQHMDEEQMDKSYYDSDYKVPYVPQHDQPQ